MRFAGWCFVSVREEKKGGKDVGELRHLYPEAAGQGSGRGLKQCESRERPYDPRPPPSLSLLPTPQSQLHRIMSPSIEDWRLNNQPGQVRQAIQPRRCSHLPPGSLPHLVPPLIPSLPWVSLVGPPASAPLQAQHRPPARAAQPRRFSPRHQECEHRRRRESPSDDDDLTAYARGGFQSRFDDGPP